MDQTRDDKTDEAGKCGGTEKIYHGRACDLSGGADVSDAADTDDDRTEDHREDHHVQGIHVNAADQTGDSQDRCISSGEEKSGQDTEDQSGKDRLGDMLLVPGIKRLQYIVPSS